MACWQGIRASIEASKEHYRKQKEYDPFGGLWLNLVIKVEENGFGALTEQEQVYFSVNLFDREIYNGGIEQFFWNSSGDYYAEVVDGLKTLNAKNCLSFLLQFTKILFGESNPPKDRALRWRMLKQLQNNEGVLEPALNSELDKIGALYCNDPDDLIELLNKYAEEKGLIKQITLNR